MLHSITTPKMPKPYKNDEVKLSCGRVLKTGGKKYVITDMIVNTDGKKYYALQEIREVDLCL